MPSSSSLLTIVVVLASCLGCSGHPSSADQTRGTAGNAASSGGASANSGGTGTTGGSTRTGSGAAAGQAGNDSGARVDITSAILGNQDVTLGGDSVIKLPPGTTTYTGVISGQGTLRLVSADGTCTPSTWIITRQSTFTLPDDRQVEVVTKAGPWPGMGYRLDIAGSDPPVLI